jgi:hypothetical protein
MKGSSGESGREGMRSPTRGTLRGAACVEGRFFMRCAVEPWICFVFLLTLWLSPRVVVVVVVVLPS